MNAFQASHSHPFRSTGGLAMAARLGCALLFVKKDLEACFYFSVLVPADARLFHASK